MDARGGRGCYSYIKKVKIFRAHPFQCLSYDVAPLKTIKYKRQKNNWYINSKRFDPSLAVRGLAHTTDSISCLDSSLGRLPTCDAGDLGSIPGGGKLNVCVQGEVLVRNVIHYVPEFLPNHHL